VVVRRPGEDGPPRVGLVVARGSGGAVIRNRIKRRLRHIVVEAQLKPGNDYVIIANRQAYEVPHPELRAWLVDATGDR
jgi:ribonuclease P protein component